MNENTKDSEDNEPNPAGLDPIEDIIEKLQEYAELEGSEFGEATRLLIDLFESYQGYLSNEFYRSLVKELKYILKNFQENSIIVDWPEEVKVIRNRKTLEWK